MATTNVKVNTTKKKRNLENFGICNFRDLKFCEAEVHFSLISKYDDTHRITDVYLFLYWMTYDNWKSTTNLSDANSPEISNNIS